ncbi:MAG TPA: GspH/FimT family pseudopilin [Steroidobacteraceae bacterium]|nr:GspH/FimT family pseudopilin [Steroidobacteraceae bacterium]
MNARWQSKRGAFGRLFRSGGFTLVELVAVLVITGVVAAYAGPRLFANGAFTERGYADEIAASLRYARRIAIASDCNVRFTVTAAGYNAAQPTVRCNTGGAWGVPVRAPDRRVLANVTPNGVAVAAAVIEFRPTGAPLNPAGPVNVGAFVVSVDAATGAVSVQ